MKRRHCTRPAALWLPKHGFVIARRLEPRIARDIIASERFNPNARRYTMPSTSNPDRRSLLQTTLVATLAVGIGTGGPAMAQARTSTSESGNGAGQAPGFYRYRIGEILVTAVNDGFGRRPLDGFVRNAELSEVQEAMRARFLSEEALEIPFTTLVLETQGRLVLIDAGNGDSGAPTSGRWMENFRAAGYAPEDVDDVVISHFHGDHVNGLRLASGEAVFPNARIHVPAAEWDFFMDDARMEAAPEAAQGVFRNARRVFAPMESEPARFEPEAEVVPGVTAIAAHGHTPGHTAFRIASGGESLLVLSDTTNHPALFVRNPGWHAIFDMDAEAAEETRRRLLGEAADARERVAFYHAPFPALGHVARDGEGFAFVPAQWTSAV